MAFSGTQDQMAARYRPSFPQLPSPSLPA